MSVKINYTELLKERLFSQYKESQNIINWLSIVTKQFDELENTFIDIQEMRWLDNAIGVQLDGVGELVGETRIFDGQEREFGFVGASGLLGGMSDETGTTSMDDLGYFRDENLPTVDRLHLNDNEFRRVIKTKILFNKTNCSINDILTAIRLLLNLDDSISITLLEYLADGENRITINTPLSEREKQILLSIKSPVPKSSGTFNRFYDSEGEL